MGGEDMLQSRFPKKGAGVYLFSLRFCEYFLFTRHTWCHNSALHKIPINVSQPRQEDLSTSSEASSISIERGFHPIPNATFVDFRRPTVIICMLGNDKDEDRKPEEITSDTKQISHPTHKNADIWRLKNHFDCVPCSRAEGPQTNRRKLSGGNMVVVML